MIKHLLKIREYYMTYYTVVSSYEMLNASRYAKVKGRVKKKIMKKYRTFIIKFTKFISVCVFVQ